MLAAKSNRIGGKIRLWLADNKIAYKSAAGAIMNGITMMGGSDVDRSPETITSMLINVGSSKAMPQKLQVQSLE